MMDRNSPEALTLPPSAALPALTNLVERWHGANDGLLEVGRVGNPLDTCQPLAHFESMARLVVVLAADVISK